MIRVENLTKDYGPVRALDSVSFEVEANQILGFLGPNGAGKSTAMKTITTYIAPTAGKVTVDGIDVTEDPIAVRRKIGYLPETNPLYVDMRVDDYLRFCGEARGLRGKLLAQRIGFVVEAAGISHVLKKEIHELSKGFKQRTGLAQALIHDPEILILDEPTSGLDPLQIIEIRKLIQELAKVKTIIFSTHILQEIQSTTERVIIVNRGKIIADGYISDLKREVMADRPMRAALIAQRDELEREITMLPGVERTSVLGERDGVVSVEIATRDGVSTQRALGELAVKRGWPVMEMAVADFTLEDVFLRLVARSKEARSKEARTGEGVSHA